MKGYRILSFLFFVLLFINFLNEPSPIDNLAFGFKSIYGARKDCAEEKSVQFNEPQAMSVLQQNSSVQCGFHALKNAVVFLKNPKSVYDDQKMYLNEDVYKNYYDQWKTYANKEGSIDQSINTCIAEKLANKESRIVVLSNVALNEGVVSFSGPIEMSESIKLFNLLARLNSENPENFAILLGVSKDYEQGHWRALLVDAANKHIFVADSYVGKNIDLTSDNRLLAYYVKNKILDKSACAYLQYYFNEYLEYIKKDVFTGFALQRAYSRIDKNLLQKFEATSPNLYAGFQKSIKELEEGFLKKK